MLKCTEGDEKSLDYVALLTCMIDASKLSCFAIGPPHFEGERRFGDRDGYRGGPRSGGEFGDKTGAPTDYNSSFWSNTMVWMWKQNLLWLQKISTF
uniref:40S ribosomal protein S10-2 n=1 Tax=Noccaea caerulescens TaxID=107243 RepID=A0A1J3G688_NOCCA